VDWVSRRVQNANVYEARELMRRIPWGTRVSVLAGAASSSFVGVLARLLSADWLGESHLDTLVSYLNLRSERVGVGNFWASDCYLSMCLKRIYRTARKTIRANRDLIKYQDKITVHGYKYLLFPANLNGNHWIVFGVDLLYAI